MHCHAFAARGVADDCIPRHRLAAGRNLGQDPLLPRTSTRGVGCTFGIRGIARSSPPGVSRLSAIRITTRAVKGRVADRREEIVDGSEPVQRGDLDQLSLIQVGQVEPVHAVELLVQQVATLGHVLLAALALEPFANALFRRGALDEVEPVAAWAVRAFDVRISTISPFCSS